MSTKRVKPLSREIAKPLTDADRERMKEEEPKKQSREEWRKKKELEEARKLGNAPAEVDEEGKDINPHIPQYISTVPWYVDPTQRASLKHQRAQEEKQKEYSRLTEWYKRGVRTDQVATRFRKGSCQNCGSMTHKKKDCFERPRKVGAKFTGSGIAPDDFVQPEIKLDFDGKRDRWNGYDPNRHQEVIEDYQKIEVAKQAVKAQKLHEELVTGKITETEKDEDNEDEDKYADKVDMPGTNFDSKRRITVRNLRIREDTAKYLRNLDPASAYYDPKTRSMRENPYADTGKSNNELDYAGDNFVRYTGDTHEMAQTQMFAWEAEGKGVDVHLQADPTRLEMLQKSFKNRKDDFKQHQRESIIDKYGGTEHLDAPPKELLLAQTEDYVEYSRHGTVVKGQEKAKTKSKYIEDVYINNHTEIWGSYWKKGLWGYKCCHSTIKQSYCTGEKGKTVQNTDLTMPPPNLTKKEIRQSQLEEKEKEKEAAWKKALGIITTTETADDEQADEAEEDEENEEGAKSLLQQHRDKLEQDKKKKKSKKRKEKKKNKKRKKRKRHDSSSSSSSSSSDSEPELKKKKKAFDEMTPEEQLRKVKEAQRKEKARVREVDRIMEMDERKRPYNSMKANDVSEPTPEEMEAYKIQQKDRDDPMFGVL